MLSNLHILYLLTFFYTALLILPSTSLAPTIIIRLSFLFTVVLPVLFILYTVVATHAHASSTSTSTPTKHSPAWIPGIHGALANHNFCEADHVYSGYYVEFFNTFSSLPIIFYGGVGPYYTRKYASKELRFACSFISIGAVGVGSALFHGTMLRFGQVLDEVPMLCIIFAGIYCFVEDAETSKYGVWFPFVLVAACISLVAGYLVFYMYSLFLLAFSSGVVLLLIRGVVVVQRAPALSSFILKISALSIAIGFSCWLADQHLCAHVQFLNLHVGWHIGTGFCGYMFTMFLLTLRASALKKKASLVVCGWKGCGWRLSEELEWSRSEQRPEFLLPYVEFQQQKL